MRWSQKLRLRFKSLFFRSQTDGQLEQELRFHLEQLIREHIESGLSPERARQSALREFGGMQKTIEECRDKRRVRSIENLLRDSRFAARMLAKSPGFTLVALLTLALGIGATTAIFSVINGVLLRPLSYTQPDRLLEVREVIPQLGARFPSLPVNPNHLVEWRKQCPAFESFSETEPSTLSLSGLHAPEQLAALKVSWNYFQVLGVSPRIGRDFLPEEDQPGRSREAVLTYALWRDDFSSDPFILGRTLTLDGAPYLVVGVMPSWFRTPSTRQPKIFTPLGIDPQAYPQMGDFDFDVIGRLRPGVAPDQALAQLNLVQARITASLSEKLEKVELRAAIAPLKDTVVKDSGKGLVLLFCAVGSVLLVVCVNLAGLLLGRASSRFHETAVRTALGATRSRLLAQFLTETVLLSVLGGASGLALAYLGLNLLLKVAPPDTPRLSEVHLDQRTFAFSLMVSVVCGLALGLAPSSRLAKSNLGETLKGGGRCPSQDRNHTKLRKVLIGTEVAISVALVSTTGLLLSSLNHLVNVDKGFQTERILAMDLTLPSTKYAASSDLDRFYTQSIENIERVPGVISAGMTNSLPLERDIWTDCASPQGDTRPFDQRPLVAYRTVNGDYFRTVGISLRSGRVFENGDRDRHVAIISESVAKLLWPGGYPIGKLVSRCSPNEPGFEVIGVVADVRAEGLSSGPTLTVYVPYWYRLNPAASIAVRTAVANPLSMTSAIRSAIWQVDKDVPVSNVKTMKEVVSGSLADRRFQLGLLIAFAASALLLAGVGVYGVVAESVASRTNEIGIRVALGAKPGEIIELVLREGLGALTFGIVCGVAANFVIAKTLNSLLFEVSATDLLTLISSASVLALVGVVACLIPARRAVRVNPMSALRFE